MKKYLLLIVVFAAFSSVLAQTKLGVKALPELSSVYNASDFKDATNGLLRMGVGLQFVQPLAGPLKIETGLYLLNRGMNSNGTTIINGQNVIIGVGDAEYRYQYIGLPFAARLDIGPVYLAGGIQFEFLSDASISYTLGNVTIKTPDEDARSLMVSGLLAAGFEKKVAGPLNFFAEARWNGQISEVYAFDGAPKIQNVGLGLGFNIGF